MPLIGRNSLSLASLWEEQHLLTSAVWDGGAQLGQPGTHLLAHQLFPLIKERFITPFGLLTVCKPGLFWLLLRQVMVGSQGHLAEELLETLLMRDAG